MSEEIIIKFGVPQGSVLGPVLFNLYIRSIYGSVQKLGFMIHGYADDHQILKSFKTGSQSTVLNQELSNCFMAIKRWMNQYYLKMNDAKTQIIVFGPSNILQNITIGGINNIAHGTSVRFVPTVKNLGIYMDAGLTMARQISELKKKSFYTLRNICKIRFLLTRDQLRVIANSLVVSCLDYCNSLYYGIADKLLHQIQLIQNAAAKVVTGKYKYDHIGEDLKDLHWLDIRKRILFKLALLVHKSITGTAPQYLQDLVSYAPHGHAANLLVPTTHTKSGRRSFGYIGPKLYNNLPRSLKEAESVITFKKSLKTYLFNLNANDLEKLVA